MRIGNFETSQRTGPAALKKNDGSKGASSEHWSAGLYGFGRGSFSAGIHGHGHTAHIVGLAPCTMEVWYVAGASWKVDGVVGGVSRRPGVPVSERGACQGVGGVVGVVGENLQCHNALPAVPNLLPFSRVR